MRRAPDRSSGPGNEVERRDEMEAVSVMRQLAVVNVVAEDLAAGEAMWRERAISLEADVDVYRALAKEAIEALAALTKERDSLRQQLAASRQELSQLRASQQAPAVHASLVHTASAPESAAWH